MSSKTLQLSRQAVVVRRGALNATKDWVGAAILGNLFEGKFWLAVAATCLFIAPANASGETTLDVNRGASDPLIHVQFSPVGENVAAQSYKDSSLILGNFATGSSYLFQTPSEVASFVFSHDGKFLISSNV